jgi:23S rRNA (adenine2503-C2)-methyltransferase
MKRIIKALDGSINYIIPYKKSVLECRFVPKSDKYFSLYLSSHNGCKMGCKFCWLTEQKQTSFSHVNIEDFVHQVNTVLDNVKQPGKKENIRCNVNFMSRGEPLANKYVINNYPELYDALSETIENYNFIPKMNISTIMPFTVKNKSLCDIFKNRPVNLYYSLYSVDEKFKHKWMPNAMPYSIALDKLKEYQEFGDNENPLTIHGTFIKGENDSIDDINRMADEIEKREFKKIKFNIVQFNPHSNSSHEEIDNMKSNDIYKKLSGITNFNDLAFNTTRIVPRVGPDAYASCGMFVPGNQ